jgi:hypothetical protein
MWPQCLRLGVAAITYSPFTKIDLSKYDKGEPKHLWDRLEPPLVAVHHFVCEFVRERCEFFSRRLSR